MSLTELSIRRPTFVVVIFSVLILLGIFSYFSIGYELLPKMSRPMITISTQSPGAAPSEVENGVTKKIEDALSSIEKLNNIRSASLEGMSKVVVEFDSDANIDLLMQDAQRKVDGVASSLPKTARAPEISKFSTDDAPVMKLAVASRLDQRELYELMDQRLIPRFSKIGGVANIGLMGGEQRCIRVNIDRAKLERYSLDAGQVLDAIRGSNLDFPAGAVQNESGEATIRLAGKFHSVSEIGQVVVAARGGNLVHVNDVASVMEGSAEQETISRYNGLTSLGLLVYKQTDANAVAVSEDVQREVQRLQQEYAGQGLQFSIAQDTSDFTLKAAEAVNHDLLLAIVLVAAVMLVFLHSLRNSVIVMLAIPASLVSTYIAIHLLGYTFNLMTLLALSLVIGILVDDSIVVLENIQRHMEMGKHKRQAALDGRIEIGFTALSITMVDVVVFLPITMVDGMVAQILKQFSAVVVVSTLMSLFVCFTLTPLLVSRWGKLTHPDPTRAGGRLILWVERQIERLSARYRYLLRWSLGHKRWIVAASFLLLIGACSLVGLGFIGSEFVSVGDRGELVVNVELPKDATLEQTNRKVQEAEAILLSRREVAGVFSTLGRSRSKLAQPGERYKSELGIKLVDKKERSMSSEAFSALIKRELEAKMEGVKISTSQVDMMGNTSEAPIQVVLEGDDTDTLLATGNRVMELMSKIPGVASPKVSIENNTPELRLNFDKQKMAALGLRMDRVGSLVNLAFSGDHETSLSRGNTDVDIDVRLDAFNRQSVDELRQLGFVNDRGAIVRLDQFATFERAIGPAKLERKDRRSSVTVSCEVVGRPQGTVGGEIQAALAKEPLPAGISLSYEGNIRQQAEAFGTMGYALIASIIFVYLIMVALYNSYVYPFVVLFSIPVALIGALLALALTMESLNIFSLLGIIMLVGLVAKNAILIVDYTNQLRDRGYSVTDALLESGKTRLRPILMTTIAMVIGMLPLALASGAGAEWKNGMAWALIGGLTSSMLLTLVLVPVMYMIIERLRLRLMARRTSAAATAPLNLAAPLTGNGQE